MTRWVRFRCADSRAGFGALEAESIVEYVGDLFDRPILSGATIARDRVKLLAPCMPSKIVALWNNFHALAAKLEKKAPVHPLFLALTRSISLTAVFNIVIGVGYQLMFLNSIALAPDQLTSTNFDIFSVAGASCESLRRSIKAGSGASATLQAGHSRRTSRCASTAFSVAVIR